MEISTRARQGPHAENHATRRESPGMNNRSHAVIRHEIIRNASISDRALRLYLTIASHEQERGAIYGHVDLATLLHVSRSTVRRAALELVAMGLVTVERRQGATGRPRDVYRAAYSGFPW